MSELKEVDFETVHDFTTERLNIMVLGCFTILKKPFSVFILNSIFVLLLFILNLYLFVMGIVTVVLEPTDKLVVCRALQNVGLLFFAMVVPMVRFFTASGLNEAVDLIRVGVYEYEETFDGDVEIKKKRVGQFRRMDAFLVKFFFCSFFVANAVFIPVMKLMFISGDASDDLVNPYLPLPIYMPFDTNSSFGFSVAFTSNALYFFFFYLSAFCSVHTYVSCAVQLIAQLEILSESLVNIQSRARGMFYKTFQDDVRSQDTLYDSSAFQTCLYFCLRENVLHHQSILRLMEAMRPFMNAFNLLCAFLFSIVMAASIMFILESPEINLGVIATFTSQVIGYLIVNGIGQAITDKSTLILSALYSTPWMYCDSKFNTMLRIMMTNAKKPITLMIIGLRSEVSLENFGDMIGAGYKIMNLFRQ